MNKKKSKKIITCNKKNDILLTRCSVHLLNKWFQVSRTLKVNLSDKRRDFMYKRV